MAKKLDHLSNSVQLEQLIGGFLQLKVATLNFEAFSLIINWLIQDNDDEELSIMY